MLWLINSSACVEKSLKISPTQRAQLQQYISRTAPHPQHSLHVRFDSNLELVGYDVSADNWQPGATLQFVWHWRVLKAVDPGWRLFTHVAPRHRELGMNADGEGIVRALYPLDQWSAGEYIRDVQSIQLQEGWSSPQAIVYLGAWKGDKRLKITAGPSDGQNRALAVAMSVGTASTSGVAATPAARPAPPQVDAVRTTKALKIDGKLDEPAWQQAGRIDRFVDPFNGQPTALRATVRLLWDARYLYLGWEVIDRDLRSGFQQHDDHLWEQDCVEILLDEHGDGRDYAEVQVSPRGVVFDTVHREPRLPPPFGLIDWDSGLRAKVETRGTIDDMQADDGYTVEMALPWKSLAGEDGKSPNVATSADGARTAGPGSDWRMNLFVMDAIGQHGGTRSLSWSPPYVGDFHTPERFGLLRLVTIGSDP